MISMGLAELGVYALDALASGLLLYLVAAGLTLVLRTSRFLNLAQAGFVAAGAAGSVGGFSSHRIHLAAIRSPAPRSCPWRWRRKS